MARLIYSAIQSLDGYVADEEGNFDWAAPDEEVHRAVNDVERSAGTFLLGRRMYKVLQAWEDPAIAEGEPDVIGDFAQIWRSADKVVYSKTLRAPSTARTRIERDFDPEAVRRMKETSTRDLTIGGPELAAQAFKAGLVDECHVFVVPVLVGGGNRAFREGVSVKVALVDERRFSGGAVYLRYDVVSA